MMMTNTKKRFGRRRLVWAIALVALVAVAIGMLWPTNYYVESPGDAFSVGQFLKSSAHQRYRPNNLYLVTVSLSAQPVTAAEYVWSYTQPFDERIPAKALLGGASNSQYAELQTWYMETSQQNAVYLAAKTAGLKPKLSYHGVYVMGIQAGSSFKHQLQIGDTIVGANQRHFKSVQALMNYLQTQRLSATLRLQIIRGKRQLTLRGKIVKVTGTKRRGIGISLVERVKVTTHPKLQINAADIGGPSAGLMFTLASYQVFTHHQLAKGQRIAGTGTISPDGKVGIIGGVDKKVVAASRAGCQVFFAPTDSTGVKANATNYVVAKKTAERIHTKMKIVPVATFRQALNYLKHHQRSSR